MESQVRVAATSTLFATKYRTPIVGKLSRMADEEVAGRTAATGATVQMAKTRCAIGRRRMSSIKLSRHYRHFIATFPTLLLRQQLKQATS